MTALEFDQKFASAVKSERKITREVLEMIRLAEDRRVPLELGFKDTYDWLIRGHGYSGGAANRRIQAARLLKDAPEVAEKVEAGTLNLTTLWQVQKSVKAEQKATGKRVSSEQKKIALKSVEGKTSREAEVQLQTLFPNAEQNLEKIVLKRNGGLCLTVQLTAEQTAELERSKELLSHAMPGASFAEIICRLAKEHNDRKDPLRRGVAPTPQRGTSSSSQRHGSKIRLRTELIQAAGGSCSFVDPRSGRRCGSRFQLEIDHIVLRRRVELIILVT